MIFLIFLLQSDLVDEAVSLFEQLQSFGNPIYYAIFILFFAVVVVMYFFKNIYTPIVERHLIEKERLVLKNTRLMALFAELDPDPIIRIDINGKIIQTNDAALEIDKSRKILHANIKNILPIIDVDIKEFIMQDCFAHYTKTIDNNFFSILFRGNSYLKIGQIYFRNITEQKKTEKKLSNSRKQLKNLSNHLQNILEEERHRIARELHDGIGQNLSLTRLNINNILSENAPKNLTNQMRKVIDSLDITISDLKEISHRLKPKILDEMGLEPALTSLVNDITNELNIRGTINFRDCDERMNPKFEICVYRTVQESLNNIIKHSQATDFNIQLINNKKIIRIIVSDNGIGFESDKILKKHDGTGGMGLLNIHERIINYDGVLKIDSSPGNGTILIIEIPNRSELWKTKIT